MKRYTVQETRPDFRCSPHKFVVINGQRQSLPPLMGVEAGDVIVHIPADELHSELVVKPQKAD